MLLVIPAAGYYIYNDYNKILADRAQQQSIMRNVDATILKALPPSSTIRKSVSLYCAVFHVNISLVCNFSSF